MNLQGKLIIQDKIWFNDILRCRLRICGFAKEHIEKFKNSRFIDITLFYNHEKDEYKAVILINELNDKDKKEYEEINKHLSELSEEERQKFLYDIFFEDIIQ